MAGVTKRLLVLRHAKSSWSDPSLDDHERPLAPRGRRAGHRVARHLSAEGIEPELVLCSTARRAQETLATIRSVLDHATVLSEPALYGAPAAALVARLRRVAPTTESVLLVGHNPGLQELVLLLATPGPLRERVAARLPTGALATLEVEDWSALGPGTAQLAGLVLPRELD